MQAHAAGATVAYLPAPRGTDEPGFEALTGLPGPALVIVDDIDAAATTTAREAERLAQRAGGSTGAAARHPPPGGRRRRSWPSASGSRRREQRLTLGPLEPDAVRAIVALYAGRAVEDAAARRARRAVGWRAGLPSTRSRASGRGPPPPTGWRPRPVGPVRAAGGCARPRRPSSTDVADLESTRERERLYAVDAADEAPRASGPVDLPVQGPRRVRGRRRRLLLRSRAAHRRADRAVRRRHVPGPRGRLRQRQVLGAAGRAAAGARGGRPARQRDLATGSHAAGRAPARRARPSARPSPAGRALPADDRLRRRSTPSSPRSHRASGSSSSSTSSRRPSTRPATTPSGARSSTC